MQGRSTNEQYLIPIHCILLTCGQSENKLETIHRGKKGTNPTNKQRMPKLTEPSKSAVIKTIISQDCKIYVMGQ